MAIHKELYELLCTDAVDLVLSDMLRAFSDEYVNLILSETDCNIEIPAHIPLAGLNMVDAGKLRHTPYILVASRQQRKTEKNLLPRNLWHIP